MYGRSYLPKQREHERIFFDAGREKNHNCATLHYVISYLICGNQQCTREVLLTTLAGEGLVNARCLNHHEKLGILRLGIEHCHEITTGDLNCLKKKTESSFMWKERAGGHVSQRRGEHFRFLRRVVYYSPSAIFDHGELEDACSRIHHKAELDMDLSGS